MASVVVEGSAVAEEARVKTGPAADDAAGVVLIDGGAGRM